jgi:methylated-DNA-[protein]-cysteine S-methyltransferase
MNFDERVWELCRKVPKGKVTTYKEIAKALNTNAYQAVGNALNRNPYGIWTTEGKDMVPCHRVINSDGRVGGFALGKKKKIELLEKECVEVRDGVVDLDAFLWTMISDHGQGLSPRK